MSATPVEQASEPPPAPAARAGGVPSQLAGMIHSAGRLADLQVAIWLAGVRKLVAQLVIVSALCVLALLAVIVAILFLYE